MSLTTLRTQVYNKVNGVSGIANVYDYRRYVRTKNDNLDDIDETVEGKKRIHWWHLKLGGRVTKPDTNRTARVYYNFIIEGFMSVKDGDASVKEFENLAETVAEAFLSDLDLGGNAFPGSHYDDGEENVGLPQVSFAEEDMNNDVSLHRCQISILVSDSDIRSISQ